LTVLLVTIVVVTSKHQVNQRDCTWTWTWTEVSKLEVPAA